MYVVALPLLAFLLLTFLTGVLALAGTLDTSISVPTKENIQTDLESKKRGYFQEKKKKNRWFYFVIRTPRSPRFNWQTMVLSIAILMEDWLEK